MEEYMDNSAERRKELLAQMRKTYDDKKEPPAVHPRYKSAYGQIYNNETNMRSSGSFGIRLFLSFLLFAAFVIMDRQEYKIMDVDSTRIIKEVQTTPEIDLEEVWKRL